jgi:hexosaminidase
MWGEQVDGHNIDSRVWPRAGAVAERLWSVQTLTDPKAATPRLNQQACRMEQRGINCGPLMPGYCQMPSQSL